MARSQAASTKKEKEKKKLQKRKDKEQRKEERKANSLEGRPLEDMMAYVDENGNISAVPPDPTRKRAINTNDILIGARKHDGVKLNTQRTGRVTFFNSSKGYGFIKDDQTEESIFVHASTLNILIKESDKVSFQVERGHKGLNAVNVKKV